MFLDRPPGVRGQQGELLRDNTEALVLSEGAVYIPPQTGLSLAQSWYTSTASEVCTTSGPPLAVMRPCVSEPFASESI